MKITQTFEGTIQDWINVNPIKLHADGTIDIRDVKIINHLLFEDGIDAVVDRKWNIIENKSINLIGLGKINM